jgi:hypothetical protein
VPDPTVDFFDGVARRRHEPLLERVSTVVRFDLGDGQQRDLWTLVVRRGDLAVAHGESDPAQRPDMHDTDRPECVISTSRAIFERIAGGRTKPMTAWLRNEVVVEGRLSPLIMLERLLPGPPDAHDPRAMVAARLADERRPRPSQRSGRASRSEPADGTEPAQ